MKRNGLLAIAALALSLAFIGAYATAAGSQPSTSFPGKVGTISEMIRSPFCPNTAFLVFSMKYPKNTGNPQVDAFFQKRANDALEGYRRMVPEMEDIVCETGSNMHAYFDFLLYMPNPQTLGILETMDYYTGGAHGGTGHESFNFDLRTGRQIEIKDLFINPAIGISGIYAIAYADLCDQNAPHQGAREVFNTKCGEAGNPPRELLALSGPLSGLGHMVLTERGANLNFMAMEIWSFAQDDYTLPIPKNTLFKFGARDFWGQSAPNF
jgi:hypothetical protein